MGQGFLNGIEATKARTGYGCAQVEHAALSDRLDHFRFR